MAQMVDEEVADSIEANEPRNVLVLEAYQVILRVGWIFKTESIIIPAFLDAVAGAAWLRGCLPVINRFGQSVPPMLYSRRLAAMPQKKWSLFSSTLGMATTFLVLSGIWLATGSAQYDWMAAIFLLLYALFSAANGLNQLGVSTLQGKLIRANHRGRAMLMSTTVGVVLAILFAWLLLGRWLDLGPAGFGYIFGFTGVAFLLCALVAPLLAEPPDVSSPRTKKGTGIFLTAWQTVCGDPNFRRLNLVALLFGTVIILFPHYQALARERLNLGLDNLMLWVIVQNVGTGLFSIFAGPLADRRGNRIVLRMLLLCAAVTPVLAVVLAHSGQTGAALYSLVFLFLGLTPITLKVLVNYTLEICDAAEHARYVSTVSLGLAVPFVFSPLVGLLVDVLGFDAVLLSGAALILLAGLLTFGLTEPRHHARHLTVEPPTAGEE